jgi:hypothetical protein
MVGRTGTTVASDEDAMTGPATTVERLVEFVSARAGVVDIATATADRDVAAAGLGFLAMAEEESSSRL